MRAATVISFTAILALWSCKGTDSGSSPGKAKTSAIDDTSEKTAAEPASQQPRRAQPPIPEADLRALLDRWLKAQNEGDFASYEKLYAEKFTGVKRVGPKTFRYARKGWLANRKLMFRHAMTVETREPQFDASARVARVTFTQRWASGKFEDLGPKRMLIVRQGDALKIAQEEMLRSEIVHSQDDDADLDFYFLLDGDLVVSDATVPEKHGKAKIVDDSEPIVVHAPVNENDLDEETRALEGKEFRTDTGCVARATGFYLVSRVTPHFGVVGEWNCRDAEEDCTPASVEERAADAFAMGTPVVVAKLTGCEDGLYARPAEQPAVVDGEQVENNELAAKALRAFGKLGLVTKQKPEEESGDSAQWWNGIEKVEIFEHPQSGEILVSVHADNGGMCGEFAASAWVLWTYEHGKLRFLNGGSAAAEVLDAIDVDRDGRLELLVGGDGFGTDAALIRAEDMAPLWTLEYAYNDCPC